MAIDDNTIYGLYGSQIKDLPDKINAVKGQPRFLTASDYNYPVSNPASVNPGMLSPGFYMAKDGTVNVFNGENALANRENVLFIISKVPTETNIHDMIVIDSDRGVTNNSYKVQFFYTNTSTGTTNKRGGALGYGLLDGGYVVDNLNSNASNRVLSAKQGKVLKDFIGDLTNLTTTDKTNLVAAINELDSGLAGKQDTLTAGSNITIADESGDLVISATDTTYTAGTGINISNGVISATSTGPTVVQTTGSSTTDVMSQNAVTDLIYTDDTYYKQIAIGTDAQTGDASNGNAYSVAIGTSANAGIQAGSSDNAAEATAIGSGAVARGKYGTAIGSHAKAGQDGVFRANGCVGIGSYANSFGTAIAIGGGTGKNSQSTPNIAKASYASDDGAIAIGVGAVVSSNSGKKGSIALGAGATVLNQTGVMNIGTYDTSYGYSNSGYRLLTGLYDPQTAHDAATKGYCDNAIINGGTTAPTTTTVGAVGTQYTYVDTSGTPTAHLCVCVDVDTSVTPNTYTWQTLI